MKFFPMDVIIKIHKRKDGVLKMTMGDRIHDLRKQRGMTQSELAKILGVGRSAVLKYEKGEVENIPRNIIEKMATVFGVTPAYLMCFDQWDEEQLSDESGLFKRIQARWGEDAVMIIHNYLDMDDERRKMLLSISENFTVLQKVLNEVQGGSR